MVTRKCLHCQGQFTPKSPKHFFCSPSHRDFYAKGSSWDNYFKALLRNDKSKRKKLTVRGLIRLYREQDGKCALSGVELTKITGKGQINTNCSIDRIKPGKAYTNGNIRLVCSFVNGFRSNCQDEEFRWWCEKVSEYGRS